jgi:PPE-repeat protein
LAANLHSTALSYESVISNLTSGPWTGPSAAALASAAAPYVTWLGSTDTQAEQIGAQAKTAAALFDTVHASVVPPPVIAANRTLLLALISTNFFGQNTPLIQATETHYEEMWAQDGAALDTYHGESQTNVASLQKPSPAPPVSKGMGQDTAGPAQSLANSMPSPAADPGTPASHFGDQVASMFANLFSGGGTDGGGADLLSSLGSVGGAMRLIYYPALFATLPLRVLLGLVMQLARAGAAGTAGSSLAGAGSAAAEGGAPALMTQIGEFVDGKLQGAVGTLAGHFSSATASATQQISAKLGQASSMGSLKVPEAWSSAAQGMTRAAPVLPHTTVSAPVSTMSSGGMPGGPFGNALMGALAGRGVGAAASKAPKVIPRSPAGG